MSLTQQIGLAVLTLGVIGTAVIVAFILAAWLHDQRRDRCGAVLAIALVPVVHRCLLCNIHAAAEPGGFCPTCQVEVDAEIERAQEWTR